jgi:hypothetical protein
MHIVEMGDSEIDAVADIFLKTLSKSIPASLGRKFLVKIFLPFCQKDVNTQIFIHLKDNVNGFIITTSSDSFYTVMIINNFYTFILFGVRVLLKSPIFIIHAINILLIQNKKNKFKIKEGYSELLYMAVNDTQQRMNIGYELFCHSLDFLKKKKTQILLIQTLLGNEGFKARNFYEKLSCTTYKTYKDRIWYIKSLVSG